VSEHPWIKEIDINPLLASSSRIIALDARIILHAADTPVDALPRTAIRPYPAQYSGRWTMKDGKSVWIRPIRPEDEPLIAKFHETLSDHSVYFRYFHMEKLSTRVAHERLMQKCFIDYDREMALVSDYLNPATGDHEILAIGRLTKEPESLDGEVAVLVSDKSQKLGLGTELLRRLIEVGRVERLERIVANILPENEAMRALADHFAFHRCPSDDPSTLVAALDLKSLPVLH
jgi:acetyltransferase